MTTTAIRLILCCVILAGTIVTLRAGDRPAPVGKVRQIKIVTDKGPDCSSLKSIVQSVTRGCKTNDEKAIALYNFMQLSHYHQGYPSEKEGLGALKEINVYGWSLCGGLHTVQAALWREMGWPWRYVGWSNPGHTTVEAQYDGRWHYLDVFLRYYTWMPDPSAPGGRTIAGEEDIHANPALVTAGLEFDKSRDVYFHRGNRFEVINDVANWRAPSFLSCGDTPDGILTGISSSNRAGSPTGWATLQFDSPDYSTDVNLAPGSSLELSWNPIEGAHWWNGRQYVPNHGCGDKDYRNCPAIGPILEPYLQSSGRSRSFANGRIRIALDFTKPEVLKSVLAHDNAKWADGKLIPVDTTRPGSITLDLSSPYVMSRANYQAEGADLVEISLDHGKTFQVAKQKDFSEVIGGKYAGLVRFSFQSALQTVTVDAIVQCNRGALPYLSPGKNQITVTVADAKDLGNNRLVVTYAYHPGFRVKSYEQLADDGAELARAHHAMWSQQLTVVQKTFSAAELPASFDIDIPTPKGKFPVYPRMEFLRREIVTPDSQPLPLPADIALPQAISPEDLKTLGNPFLVGTTLPPIKAIRPTSRRTISLTASHAASADGKSEKNHFLKWKDGETWVLLVAGDLKDLPPAKEISEARLIIPVTRGHAQAATQLGVTLLQEPFQADSPFNFKQLGNIIGTTIVPKQPDDADYAPAKTFAVDLTRTVKQIASGDVKFHGFALRVIQNRSIDDGYLIRVDLPNDPQLKIEVDIYEKK